MAEAAHHAEPAGIPVPVPRTVVNVADIRHGDETSIPTGSDPTDPATDGGQPPAPDASADEAGDKVLVHSDGEFKLVARNSLTANDDLPPQLAEEGGAGHDLTAKQPTDDGAPKRLSLTRPSSARPSSARTSSARASRGRSASATTAPSPAGTKHVPTGAGIGQTRTSPATTARATTSRPKSVPARGRPPATQATPPRDGGPALRQRPRPRPSTAGGVTTLVRGRQEPCPTHSPGFSAGFPLGDHAFKSVEARDAYEAWIKRKEKQRAECRAKEKAKLDESDDLTADEKREMAESSFRAWMQRKEREKRNKREQQEQKRSEQAVREQCISRAEDRFLGGTVDPSESFNHWLEKKAAADARRKEEMRIRRKLVEERNQEQTVRQTQAAEARRQWQERKRQEEAELSRQRKHRQQRHAREARKIKKHMDRLRYAVDDRP